MVEEKNVQEKRFILGQYFTRPEICDRIVRKIDFGDSIVIEPSFGTGNFIAMKVFNPFPVASLSSTLISKM